VLLPDTAACAEPQKKEATTSINNAEHTHPVLLIFFIVSSGLETAPGPKRGPLKSLLSMAQVSREA
jgi:hypothetical protein